MEYIWKVFCYKTMPSTVVIVIEHQPLEKFGLSVHSVFFPVFIDPGLEANIVFCVVARIVVSNLEAGLGRREEDLDF